MAAILLMLAISPWLLTCQAKPHPVAKPQPVAKPHPVAKPQPVAMPQPVAKPNPEAKPKPWLLVPDYLDYYPMYDYGSYLAYNRAAQQSYGQTGPGVSKTINFLIISSSQNLAFLIRCRHVLFSLPIFKINSQGDT